MIVVVVSNIFGGVCLCELDLVETATILRSWIVVSVFTNTTNLLFMKITLTLIILTRPQIKSVPSTTNIIIAIAITIINTNILLLLLYVLICRRWLLIIRWLIVSIVVVVIVLARWWLLVKISCYRYVSRTMRVTVNPLHKSLLLVWLRLFMSLYFSKGDVSKWLKLIIIIIFYSWWLRQHKCIRSL